MAVQPKYLGKQNNRNKRTQHHEKQMEEGEKKKSTHISTYGPGKKVTSDKPYDKPPVEVSKGI